MSSPASPTLPSCPAFSTGFGKGLVGSARKGASFRAALAHARSAHDVGAHLGKATAASGVGTSNAPSVGQAHVAATVRRAGDAAKEREVDASLDPLERHAAQMGPPLFVAAPAPVVAPATTEMVPVALRAASLETLLPALVKRIAWSAEGKDRGAVRMEIGAGGLQGAVLLVQADAGEVRIHVSVPSGADREAWREKLLRRLEARGVRVASLEIE